MYVDVMIHMDVVSDPFTRRFAGLKPSWPIRAAYLLWAGFTSHDWFLSFVVSL